MTLNPISSNSIPEGFISVEYELPPCDGVYEVCCVYGGCAEVIFDFASSVFRPVPGVTGVIAWRECLPDAADVAEFKAREREISERYGAAWI